MPEGLSSLPNQPEAFSTETDPNATMAALPTTEVGQPDQSAQVASYEVASKQVVSEVHDENGVPVESHETDEEA